MLKFKDGKEIAVAIYEGKMILFYLISIAAIAVVIYYLFNPKYKNGLFDTGLALVLGGIIGNFIDRLHLKYVIDMLQLDFIQFNIYKRKRLKDEE